MNTVDIPMSLCLECLGDMLAVKRAADGKESLYSNQGQALDGYSELYNYRQILAKIEEAVEEDRLLKIMLDSLPFF